MKRPGEGREYIVVTIFLLYIKLHIFILKNDLCLAMQMALPVSTVVSCPLSAGQLIVSVLLFLAPSAASR